MKKILILFVMMFNLVGAETEFADPKPSIIEPRKLIFSISSWDKDEVNHIIGTINNVMKFYRPENTEIMVVAYSQGLKALLKKPLDVEIQKRIKSLMTYDIIFVACGNTMQTLKIDKKELLEDVEIVTAGVVEIIERKLSGFSYIRP